MVSALYYHRTVNRVGIIDNFDMGLLPFSAADVHLCAQKAYMCKLKGKDRTWLI
ncbi:hypothetical protein JCM19239_3690 [Vibrio variabilis]|uniref:Uncharacterized protein n=1 Tax=Vibrio variabilis TaxID=990271 RepID=A0ABQ0JC62_9VIBR|nr:hypothetical protein JCM19239_3690 [Vibrio variabilis]